MNTDAMMTTSSQMSFGTRPSSTASATALATAAWAGPKIWPIWAMFLTVTFGTMMVAGFVYQVGPHDREQGRVPHG